MFVLAAMFVVWQKFPQKQAEKSVQNFSLICDQTLKHPLEKIFMAFEKEYPSIISVSYVEASLIKSIIPLFSDDSNDMLICNESILQIPEKRNLLTCTHSFCIRETVQFSKLGPWQTLHLRN